MPKLDDLLAAKASVRGRYLAEGLGGGVVGRVPSLHVASASALAAANIHAIGLGKKVVNDKPTRETCVRFYVVQKLPPSLVPDNLKIPPAIEGLPTDVIETPPAFILPRGGKRKKGKKSPGTSCSKDRKKRQRPVVAGISAAHFAVTAGTISYFFRSTRAGDDPAKIHVLSNNHVFADVNKGQVGERLLQPGPADGATSSDHFANLGRFVSIVLGGTTPNKVDGAIGELLPDVSYTPQVCSIGKITGTEPATENMTVRKHGRTTGYTEGIVTDVSYDALVGMDHSDPSAVAFFENQIRIERTPPYHAIGLGGDSGSLVVKKSQAKAVGLYFAGPSDGSYGVANHIADVLNGLEIELV